MIIETLAAQDLEQLKRDALAACLGLREITCQCKTCLIRFSINEFDWNPIDDLNHTWKLVKVLELFGYPSYYWDGILYTAEFWDGDQEIKIKMNGLTFQQAMCNVIVQYWRVRND